MNIGMMIVMVVGAALASLTTGYMLVSLVAVLGYKFYRKVRYGISLFN